MYFFSFLAPSSIVASLPLTWSPWDQSPLFLQQRLSLTPKATQQLSVQTKISKYLQSLGNVMTSTLPHHPPQTIPIKSENVDCSISGKKRPTKTKQKTLNSTFSSRSLTSDKENNAITQDLVEKNKYFSNSLNCLNMKDL